MWKTCGKPVENSLPQLIHSLSTGLSTVYPQVGFIRFYEEN